MSRTLARRARPRSLARRVLAELARSPLPVSTVDLALICAFDRRNRRVRTYQVLVRQEQLGRVRRVPPLPHADHRGRRPYRWVLAGGAAP